MRAQKGNRQYIITSEQADSYLKQGFDVFGEDGKIIEYGTGKSVPYSDYMEVVNEVQELRAKVEQEDDGELLEELELENDALKTQIEELKLELEAFKTSKAKK